MKPARPPETCQFRSDKCYPRLVYGSPGVRVFLLCLESGQGLPPRRDSEEMICWMIQGRARLTVGQDLFEVSAGDFAAAGPGEVRGIEAEGRSVALWVHISRRAQDDG